MVARQCFAAIQTSFWKPTFVAAMSINWEAEYEIFKAQLSWCPRALNTHSEAEFGSAVKS